MSSFLPSRLAKRSNHVLLLAHVLLWNHRPARHTRSVTSTMLCWHAAHSGRKYSPSPTPTPSGNSAAMAQRCCCCHGNSAAATATSTLTVKIWELSLASHGNFYANVWDMVMDADNSVVRNRAPNGGLYGGRPQYWDDSDKRPTFYNVVFSSVKPSNTLCDTL